MHFFAFHDFIKKYLLMLSYLVNELYAWGYNKFGQLGTGDTTNRLTPQIVGFFNDKKLKKIDAGEYHSLALTGKYLHILLS
jgi:alpha-tubulin suppressor-like RCC1 family protein